MSDPKQTDIVPAQSSIVRVPSEITPVNSSLAKPLIPSQSALASVTFYKLDLDTILDGLIPNPLPDSSGKDNAIHHLNIIIFGKPNTGKCLTGDDVVPTASGQMLRVSNLHPGLVVFSVDENFKLVKDKIVAVASNGVKDVFRVRLSDGRQIKLTANHPLLTAYGWKQLSDLHEGIPIAVPRFLPTEGRHLDREAAKVLGYLIAEGGLTQPTPTFTNSDPSIVEDMQRSLVPFGLRLSEPYSDINYRVLQITPGQPFRTDDLRHQSYGYYKRFADEFGLRRVGSRAKKIPQSILRSDNESVGIFLSALFAGDGWVDARGNIGYGTISSVLAHQVQHCLLRFGILSRLRRGERALAWDRKRKTVSYEVWVPLEYRPKFEQHITIPKRRIINSPKAVDRHETRQIRRWSQDDFPLPISYLRSRRDRPGAWSGGAFASISEAREFAQKYERPYALKIANGDCFWPRIKSIEHVGKAQTFDVQVENTGNLVVNDIFVHNTTLGESIAQALARRYGQNNVKALRSTRDLPALFENLDKLFGRFKKPPKAILLFADDMTKALKKLSGTVNVKDSTGRLEKMRKVDYWLDKWYDIRGELFRHGMRQGLVIMVAGLHRFYGGDVDLRADADLLLVRSTGTPGTFDANKVEHMLGPTVYYAMRQHEVDALRDRKELAWTAFVAKTGSGVFRVPRPSVSTKWLMRNV
ncbi:MAG TPA: LAGLIDADG family homing endonuclease, partial [Candidatus Bathyarchaeia archaeon]|nr:LAGLIDADG family homing endonuclease [Candidatus Bathyarchaeia archaeon]